MPTQFIKLQSIAADAFEFTVAHAQPENHRIAGLIVLQEIFGLDSYVQRDVERWSQLGFEVLAPSLFDRTEPGYLRGHDAKGFADGLSAAAHTPTDTALADIASCIAFLQPRGLVCLVGYCYGGTLAWKAAAQLPGLAAVASYYGSGVAAAAQMTPQCPTICHFGAKDAHIPADAVAASLQAAQPKVPVYVYPNSGHGFNNDGAADADRDDAALARVRTLKLFQQAALDASGTASD